MSKHYFIGHKISEIKNAWFEIHKQLEQDPPMYADPHTPLYAMLPPDENSVRILLYRSSSTSNGIRVGHAQKSESLSPDWSFAYRYLEKRGKTVIACIGNMKLVFRSIQRLKVESSQYYLFVQCQQFSAYDNKLEFIHVDASRPLNYNPYLFDDWHALGAAAIANVRRFSGFSGLCVETLDDEDAETYDQDGNPPVYCSLTHSSLMDSKKKMEKNSIEMGPYCGNGANSPCPPWSTRFYTPYNPYPTSTSLTHYLAQSNSIMDREMFFEQENKPFPNPMTTIEDTTSHQPIEYHQMDNHYIPSL